MVFCGFCSEIQLSNPFITVPANCQKIVFMVSNHHFHPIHIASENLRASIFQFIAQFCGLLVVLVRQKVVEHTLEFVV
jgi:hypothetical protein